MLIIFNHQQYLIVGGRFVVTIGLNVRWQGLKIRQCRLEGGAQNVITWKSVYEDAIYFNLSQKLTNRKRPKITHIQYVIKMSDGKLVSKDEWSLMAKEFLPTCI